MSYVQQGSLSVQGIECITCIGVASGSGWNLWVWLVGGMYGCGYQEVGVVGRRRVWLAGGIYGCGYQEWVWLAGGGCG